MLPKLTSLDTLLLAEETKQLAEATFLKKQMYYNMRIKTMLRNARNIIRLADEGKKVSTLCTTCKQEATHPIATPHRRVLTPATACRSSRWDARHQLTCLIVPHPPVLPCCALAD